MSHRADTVKIQINSMEALERLIGGDADVEFEVRRSVAADFARKYIKGILSKEEIRAIQAETLEFLKREFGVMTERNGVIRLPDNVRAGIQNEVRTAVAKYLEDMISKEFAAFEKEAKTTILPQLREYAENWAQVDFRAKVKREVDAVLEAVIKKSREIVGQERADFLELEGKR